MKFKGQGKINMCGFEYKKNIADSRRGGGGFRAPQQKTVSAPAHPPPPWRPGYTYAPLLDLPPTTAPPPSTMYTAPPSAVSHRESVGVR